MYKNICTKIIITNYYRTKIIPRYNIYHSLWYSSQHIYNPICVVQIVKDYFVAIEKIMAGVNHKISLEIYENE